MASPDNSSEIISVVMDENGSLIYDLDLVPDHVPPPKTTNCMRHTMTQHDSPAKVFAKMKSQIQREHHPLTEVASNHPAFGSNLFPKPHLSCEKRVSEDEVLALKRDQEFKNVGSVKRRLIKGQGCYSQMEKPTSAVYKANDVPDNTIMEDFGSGVGNALSYNNLDMTDSQTAVTADPLLCHNLPQTHISYKRTCVNLERLPQMSPAKLFVHIKENERNRRIHEGYKAGCGTITLHQRGHFQPQDRSTSTAFHKDEMELKSSMDDVRSVPGSADPISESKLEGADDPGGDVQPLVVDPLLLSSPSISFRKIREDRMIREDVFKWPAKPSKSTPQKAKVTGVYLTRWLLKSNSAGLYVDGIRKDDKRPWHSSVIVERLSNTMLRTSSGKTYNLVGKMIMPIESDLPRWFLKQFTNGFPEDWRISYDQFMSESLRETSSKVRRVKSLSEEAVTNQSVKHQRPNVRRTTVSCTTEEVGTSSAKTGINRSRSGRIIKPPLDYWRGGRVVMDKDMNMTIHNSYETTVSFPQVEAEVTVSRSNREERTRSERNASEMAPLRKVKPPPRHRDRARAKPDKQTGGHNEPLNTDLSIPEGCSRRSTRSTAGIAAIQPALCTDGVPESEAIFNHRSRRRSKSPKRRLPKKCNPPVSSDPPTADQASDSSDDFWVKGNSRRKGTKVLRETASKTRKTLNKAKLKEDDEDQWSEAELARLQKAVNLFPKHLGSFWDNVAQMVGTRSAEACQREHMPQGIVSVRTKTSRKKEVPVNEPEPPKITAGVGTLKRKQQVRQLLKAIPKENYDDAFTNASMFANRFQFPDTLSCEESDDEFVFPDLEPVTPGTAGFPTVKTPQCHHITEDMLGSVNTNRDNDDRCVYQLQKRLKKSRANVHLDRHAVKDIKPSGKRSEKRCLNGGNDSFLVWETRPDSASSLESGEEEDFYFED